MAALDELIGRLAAFEPNGFPVISLYLNTEPDQHGRANYHAFVRKEFRKRARTFAVGSSERESYDRDVERIQNYLENELKPSANSAAIFTCGAADLFEAIEIEASSGDHRLYISDQPHLYQLARLNDEYPRYAAVLADTNSARLFVFGLGQLLTQEDIRNTKTRGTRVGGWSQARYQRHIENYHVQHAKEVIDALDRAVREENLRAVILAGDDVIVPKLREQLPPHLAEKIIDTLRLDINAPETEVLQATLESLREQDARDDADKVRRLLGEYRAGGLAVVGPADTLAALEIGQVDELLLSAALEHSPLAADEEELARPLVASVGAGGSAPPASAAVLADDLVTRASQTSARVSFIQDQALLAGVGGAGAFLRYRI